MKDFILRIWVIFSTFIIALFNHIKLLFSDDKGNLSSMRILLAWAAVLVHILLFWWMELIEIELAKSNPNVDILRDVLKDLIYPIVAILITGIIGKVIQKKLESKL